MSKRRRSDATGAVAVLLVVFYGICILGAIAVLVVGIIRPINKVCNIRQISGTVTEKTVKRTNGDDKYLVFITGEDGAISTLEITDSLFSWRWDSSDVYAGIEVGKTYEFTVGGSRVPILSWYPNIYSYK